MYKVHQSFSIIQKALHQLHASIRDSRGSEGNAAGWWCSDDDDDNDVTLLHRARQGHQGLNDGVNCGEPHICRKGQSEEDNVILLQLNHQLWICFHECSCICRETRTTGESRYLPGGTWNPLDDWLCRTLMMTNNKSTRVPFNSSVKLSWWNFHSVATMSWFVVYSFRSSITDLLTASPLLGPVSQVLHI